MSKITDRETEGLTKPASYSCRPQINRRRGETFILQREIERERERERERKRERETERE